MIQIKDRFRPFSHTPGSMCMIPKSNWAVEAYPTEIRIIQEGKNFPLNLELTGPVQGFTLEQDLEKNVVRVFGRAKEGYFNFEISHEIKIVLKRGKSIPYQFLGKEGILERNQILELKVEESFSSDHPERLSLGMNKKLDWDLVARRGDLKEILPVLFFLGQKINPSCGDYPISLKTFLAQQFQSILVPLRESKKSLGLPAQDLPSDLPISFVLRKSYEAIRALFVEEKNGAISILPHLPSEFVSGRMTCIKTSQAIFDFEWTKRKLRRMQIKALQGGILTLKWPKEVDSFRLNGKMIAANEELVFSPGQVLYLDKFQK